MAVFFTVYLVVFSSLRAEFPAPTNNQAITTIPLTPPEKTIGMMHLPPGFKATLFAHEPDVQQPIAMCWDERGRLWIAENYTYSDGEERFDMKLKDRILIFEDTDNDGHFDKRTVFADDLQMLTSIERGFGGVYALCPPHLLWIPTKDDKPSGPPQILLDGFCTTATSRHTLANGLKWGPDGWLYGRIGISSTSWVGVPGTPQEKSKPTAGGIWRYHPTRKIYEPYCHGTTNPWGMDWDEHGELFFINTVIGHLWHGIQGAHFKRMHGEDPYPHIYGLIDQHADHYHWDTGKKWNETRDAKGLTDELGGGHAHVGMMIYQGTNFPKEYRGKVFTNNLNGHRVNVDRIEREGSGYVGKHEPDFMKTDDPWFRGIEICQGPDGGVYILDWSDIGECHEDDGVHRTSGRIYKITYGDPVKPKETDVSKLSDEELVKLQLSENEWLVRMARWELRERAWRGDKLDPAIDYLMSSFDVSNSSHDKLSLFFTGSILLEDAAMVWDSKSSVGYNLNLMAMLGEATKSPDDFVKVGTLHWQARPKQDYLFAPLQVPAKHQHDPKFLANLEKANKIVAASHEKTIKEICDDASKATSQYVRLAWTEILTCLNPADQSRLANVLLSHAEDATDHNLPLMYWYGICDLPPAELVKLVKDCRIPLVTQFIARRITEDIEKDSAPLNALLELASRIGLQPVTSAGGILPAPSGKIPEAPDNGQNAHATSIAILTGMTDALKGWRKAKKPAAWDKFAAFIEGSAGLQPAATEGGLKARAPLVMLRDLNVLFGDGRALDEIRAIALDDNADTEARKSALATLIEAKSPDARKICEKLLTERSLAVAAVQGLATFDDPAIAELIVKRWRSFYSNEHSAVIAALVSRPSFAKVLLKNLEGRAGLKPAAIEGGLKARAPLITREEITPVIARQIRSFNDDVLTKQLTETWGEIRESTDDKKKLIAALKAKLTPEFIAKGDQTQGRLLFSGICAACHKLYGEGNSIGPDLTGSGRHDVGYLIENIIDPNVVVAADFTMAVVTLKDGRVLNGIISEKTERTITIKMVGTETTVDRNDIVKQEQLPVSMMPEGQINAMNDQQMADLFAYLMGNAQVPLPKP